MRFLGACFIILGTATTALAQFGGFGGPGGGGMGAMMNNPNMIFDQIARGKDYITRSDIESLPPMFQGRALAMYDKTLQDLGITNGQLTRDQFKTAFDQGVRRMRDRGMGGPGGGGANPEAVDRFVEDRFRSLDKNGDGLLQLDEMPDALKAERDKWDTNKDGFIDLTEYKAYTQARFGERNNDQRGNANPADGSNGDAPVISFGPTEQLPDARPVVFRAGKLPKELPAWFAQLDSDQDGQVGLYEWVRGGRSLQVFREMDLNDDGFLTAEEVIQSVKNKSSSNGAVVTNTAPDVSSTPRPEARPPEGGNNGSNDGRRGPGNGGWGGSFRGGRNGGNSGGGGWPGSRGR